MVSSHYHTGGIRPVWYCHYTDSGNFEKHFGAQPACLLVCLSAYFPANLPICQSANLLTSLPACPPPIPQTSSLPTSQPANEQTVFVPNCSPSPSKEPMSLSCGYSRVSIGEV